MRRLVTVGGVLTALACALGWLFLAPTNIGGRTTYVMTHGISMEPKFHTGDLAVLYPHSSYHVGEIAAYRSATLHTVVMHRIVAQDGNSFTFKGDNNSWLDPDHPTQADILGSLSFEVPGGARYINFLHGTEGQAVAGGLLALLLLGGAGRVRRRRALRTSRSGGRHRAGRHRAPAPPSRRTARRLSRESSRRRQPPSAPVPVPTLAVAPTFTSIDLTSSLPRQNQASRPNRMSRAARSQVVGTACVVIACLAAEAWLWQLPTNAPATRSVAVTQTGTFGYSATAPASLVYPTGAVKSGDPIFTKIVHTVDFSFNYESATSTTGTVALKATLVGPTGWQIPLVTGQASRITAGRGTSSVEIDLDAARTALDQFKAATGVSSTNASLVIEPAVQVHGTVEGVVVNGQFAGNLSFSIGTDQLTVVTPATPRVAGTTTSAAGNDPFTLSSPIDARVPAIGPRVLSVLGQHIAVRPARVVIGIGSAIAVGLLIAALLGSRREDRAEDDVVSAMRQYGDRIVDAESIPLEGPIVELTSLAALHSIAERYDRVILHSVRGERHSYVVRDELSWYRYDIRPDRGQHAARRSTRDSPAGVEATVISLQPRPDVRDILPGGVGVEAWAWADGYSRAG